MTTTNDETRQQMLIAAAQRGRSRAFRQLLSDYHEPILGLALRITASEAEARCLYRESMLGIHQNLSSFRFECAFHIWIYRNVTAVSMDYVKRKRLDAPGSIDAALQCLTPRERMVVELKHYLGESLAAIGEMLGTTEEAARSALIRGIQKLSSRLNEHDPVNPW